MTEKCCPAANGQSAEAVTLRARYVFSVPAEPLEDATVTIAGGRIVAVGEPVAGARIVDLGNAALTPGLINAHTHLELSDVDGPLGEAGIPLCQWTPQVVAHRRREGRNVEDAVRRGLRACAAAGETGVGDIVQPGWSEGFLSAYPGTVVAFQEMLGWTPDRAAAMIEAAGAFLHGSSSDKLVRGVSPHAPQTVSADLLEEAIRLSTAHGVPLAMHLAESSEEIELLARRSGPLRALLENAAPYDPDRVLIGRRPLDYLRRLAEACRTLVIHGNYLDSAEIDFLAACRETMAVVFCPRTHARFGHPPYPLREMLDRGVTVALGTDSAASSPDLNLFNEMRYAARSYPGVSPAEVLAMATVAGARALGLTDHARLEPGAPAYLACIDLPSLRGHACALLFHKRARIRPVHWLSDLPGA